MNTNSTFQDPDSDLTVMILSMSPARFSHGSTIPNGGQALKPTRATTETTQTGGHFRHPFSHLSES